MTANKETRKLIVSRFDGEQNIFYLKPQNEGNEEQAVSCNLKLHGTINGTPRFVNTNLPLSDYEVFRFTNPYLNAQNDLFKVKYDDKSIGYIIPFSAIEDENNDDDFDEHKQAYKYYCIKSIIEQFNFETEPTSEPVHFSKLVDKNSIFVVLYKPQINDEEFTIGDCLPSFALSGYYFFQENTKPNVLLLAIDKANDIDLANLIDVRFITKNRGRESVNISKTNIRIDETPLLSLLYKKLLVENNNPLHRFLILYQVIEFLVEKKIRDGINQVCLEKDKLNNYDFFQKLHEVNDTRLIINSLFNEVTFNEKAEITNSLKNFILQTNASYSKQNTGDCFYDIRNLLFHDFKSVLEKNRDGAVTSLVIQCEILIHQLLISLGNEEELLEALTTPPATIDSETVEVVLKETKKKWFQFWKS